MPSSSDSTAGLQELYEKARVGQYGFFASNVTHFDVLIGLLKGSTAVDADLVVQASREEVAFFGGGDPATGLNILGATLDSLAERYAIEVFCNIDHIHLPEERPFLETCLDSDVPDSVMVDTSDQPFDKNVKLTAETVDRTAENVLVEAELGRIAGTEGNTETATDEAFYTNPETAVEFVERTGCDLLAISIGTQHGVASDRDLDVRPDLAVRINDALIEAGQETILVVHGASGLADDRIKELLDAGVCKFNKNTRYQYEFARTAADFYHDHENMIRPPDGVVDDRSGFFADSNWSPEKASFHPHVVSNAARDRVAAVMSDLCEVTGNAGETMTPGR